MENNQLIGSDHNSVSSQQTYMDYFPLKQPIHFPDVLRPFSHIFTNLQVLEYIWDAGHKDPTLRHHF